jgi:hypothetical protein
MKRNDFYVGYFDLPPKGITQFIKIVVAFLALTMLSLAWFVADNQRGFISSTYEYDQEITLSGLLISNPVPAIQLNLGESTEFTPLIHTIPIVAFGKKGGDKLVRELSGTLVNVKGHLIYHDGKTLIEISNPDNIESVGPRPSNFPLHKAVDDEAEKKFTGEIVDAKCFFGVMKPGHGKPHRSCAIRCISGGVPAVFRSTDSFGDPMYQLIILESTSPKILADFIGEVVEITGIEGEFYDWKTLKINTPSSIRPLTDTGNTNLSGALSMCR